MASVFQEGDLIRCPTGSGGFKLGLNHYGIYYCDNRYGLLRHKVIEAHSDGVVRENQYYSMDQWEFVGHSPDRVATMKRALSSVGTEFQYCTVRLNCEHWARFWLTGDQRSFQATSAQGFGYGAIAGSGAGGVSGALITATVAKGGIWGYVGFTTTASLWALNPLLASGITVAGAVAGSAIGSGLGYSGRQH